MVSRRRRELVELVAQVRRLPPDQQIAIGRVALAYAGVPVALELAGLVVGVRTLRQLWRERGSDLGTPLAVVRRSPLLPLLLAHAAYRWIARVVLLRWLRRRVPPTSPDEGSP